MISLGKLVRAVGLATALAVSNPAQSGGLMPWGPASTHSANGCVTTEELGNAKRAVDTYARTTGMLTSPTAASSLPFFPLAGRPGRDIFAWYYADLDPTSGIHDFRCTPFTYDGHDATDACLRSFGEMDVGMPIFAAGDGRVIAVDDGHPDRNTAGNLQPNNYVVIDHGNGRVCYYWHMRRGSVLVAPKQLVRAGDQIGMCGSSGHSSFPHLHFSVYENGVPVEPHSGACQPSTTRWLWQPEWQENSAVWDCGITRTDPTSVLPYPERGPSGGQIALSDPYFYFWAELVNQPANSTWRARFKRPDNSIAYESAVTPFNPAYYYRWWVWYWRFDVPDLHSIPGTWTFELELNGSKHVTAPFEVTIAYDQNLNHAPEPITLSLDPVAPTGNDPITCKVATDLLVDDKDYDLVRFRYEWRVNSILVRDVTSAAHSDVLAAGQFVAGNQIQCRVTPTDGKQNGARVTVSTTATPPFWADLGYSKAGTNGAPALSGVGVLLENEHCQWILTQAQPNASGVFVFNVLRADIPILGGVLVPDPNGVVIVPIGMDATGSARVILTAPLGLPSSIDTFFQCWVLDTTASFGVAASNALHGKTL